jgi:hypothetical protein
MGEEGMRRRTKRKRRIAERRRRRAGMKRTQTGDGQEAIHGVTSQMDGWRMMERRNMHKTGSHAGSLGSVEGSTKRR